MHAQHSKDADAARRAHREIRPTASVPREREDDVPMSPAAILALQRSAGNAVVSRLLDQERELRGHVPPGGDEVNIQRDVDVHAAISRGGGRPLNPDVQAEMETRMGQAPGTFDPVRVVGGTEGKSVARALGARALTSGSRIYGDVSEPHTLVHELTHVIQQSRGPVAGTDNGDGVKISDPSDRFEREAEANATRVLSAPVPARPAEEAETPVQRAYSASHPVQRAPSAPPKRSRTESSERSESPAPAAKRFQSSLPLRPQNRLTKGPEITFDSDRSARPRGLASLNHHDLEILVGFLDDVSQGNVDIKEVEAGTLSTEYFVRKIDFKDWSVDELSHHVREMLRQQNPASKAFNVRSRAENVTAKDGLVFTDDVETRRIADDNHDLFVGNYDLGARILSKEGAEEEIQPVDLDTFRSMIDKAGWKPRTVNANPKMIYYGPELTKRPPHESPAKLRDGIGAPPRPTGTQLSHEFKITGACKRGTSSKTRAGAMGNYSALNYAKAVGYPAADKMRWEWLHLIGSAIGGENEEGNLVAGTYDANTQMTMLEGNITKYCAEKATPDNPVKLEVKATLWSGSGGPAYIATRIQMIVTQGDREIANDTFDGVRAATMNKMEYDFYKSAFFRKFTPAQNPMDALKQRALKEG